MYIYTFMYIYICMCMYIEICIYIYMTDIYRLKTRRICVYIYTCMYIYTGKYIYICMFISWIYIHIQQTFRNELPGLVKMRWWGKKKYVESQLYSDVLVSIDIVECMCTLQHTATHCNTLQHTATHCNTLSACVQDSALQYCSIVNGYSDAALE